MQNTISERVADFLQNFPPFNTLEKSKLDRLSQQVSIIYHEKGGLVFSEDETPHDFFYIVHQGAIALRKIANNEIVDICDEGDIFGLRPLMANENYKLEARAHEESILYGIPITLFKPYARESEEVGNFLIGSFASNTRNPYSKVHRGKLYGNENAQNINPEVKLLDLQPVNYSKKLVSCTPKTAMKRVAETMTKHRIGSMLVVEDELPIGIITDKDLRNKIVTGIFPIDTPASKIMSQPVITYPRKMTVTQAQMAMMKSNISHLVLTRDGTPHTKAVGILSKHDVMVSLGDNPAVLVKAIKRAKKYKQIKPLRKSIQHLLQGYLDQNIPMGLTAKIIAELNDTCIKQVIAISLKKMRKPPPVKFAWLSIGSQGRSEQLLHTDQDNALLFEDVVENQLPKVTKYFLTLAKHITHGLKIIGFDYCPAEMMASNPKWCLSLQEWKDKVSHWIINPGPDEVLMSSIFFDYNVSYGNKELVNELSEHIFQCTEKYPIFFLHLASGALQNPSPTGFFRQFLVEQDGAHKDFFDLKQRALMPLIDAARVLILSHSVKAISNTWERYEKLAELEPKNKEFYLACSYATKALLKFRTKQGLVHHDSGRYIALEKLNKEEKIKLKRTFKTIKEIQELLSVRFKVSNLLG
jgi:CBS domain-containing protein